MRPQTIDKDVTAIILLEHERGDLLVAQDNPATLLHLPDDCTIFHICGNVNPLGTPYTWIPKEPAPFGRMSILCDYADPSATVRLLAAGLSVGQGMKECRDNKMPPDERKVYLTHNYPAIAFKNRMLW